MLQLENDDALKQLQGHSITCRIAVGPQAGRKVLTPQTIFVLEGMALRDGQSISHDKRKNL